MLLDIYDRSLLMSTMILKSYAANTLRHLPIATQRAALAKVDSKVAAYEDVLKPRQLKAHTPADLTERARLLQPTQRRGREETIYLASLGVLAWGAEDFAGCLRAAKARNATLVALDTGRIVTPAAGAEDFAGALSEFLTARRKALTTGGRLAGPEASRAVRMADAEARLEKIKADWHAGIVPTGELLLRAGKMRRGRMVPMAWMTAVKRLGRRPTPAKMRAARKALEEEMINAAG